jgi:ABC-type sugar transport system ATPase subunit
MAMAAVAREPAVEQLRAEGVTKVYPGMKALTNIDLTIRRGEIHALIGQNGAGKSTLVKILSGAELPDAGAIYVGGRRVRFNGPHGAQQAGIQTIYQELSLVPQLSVAENIFLGDPPQHRNRIIAWPEMRRRARQVLARIGFDLDVSQPAARYTVAEQQAVELAKALHKEASVILLDEPTATLPPPDVKKLFEVLRTLTKEGVALIYISHRLEEIHELCDMVTVLRDGEKVATMEVARTTTRELVSAMVGNKLVGSLEGESLAGERVASLGTGSRDKVLMSVRGLTDDGRISGVSFDVHAGEVLGVVGLVGSGQSEVASCLAGVRGRVAGEIALDGKPAQMRSPREAVRRGVGLLPQDRKAHGFVPDMSVAANMTLASLPQFSRFSVRNSRKEMSVARAMAERLDMRIAHVGQPMKTLSGGTQQKAIMARWLVRSVRVLICDEPTRGVDVAARQEIYELIRDFAGQGGTAVILATSELSEALMCDRVLVMARGRLVAELNHQDIDPHGEAMLRHFA